MYLSDLDGCCAVTELQQISDHSSPEHVLESMCIRLWSRYNKPVGLRDPGAHIIFTGVEKYDKRVACTCDDEDSYNGDECARHDTGQYAVGYGSELAAYIKEHKLGRVVGSPSVRNRNNHPTHFVKVWVWSPNYKALSNWYVTNYKKSKGDDIE